jgi:hypothetical protein
MHLIEQINIKMFSLLTFFIAKRMLRVCLPELLRTAFENVYGHPGKRLPVLLVSERSQKAIKE